MSHEHGAEQPPEGMSEEELRMRLEEELRRITVHDVILQTVVSLVNLGGQRLGLTPDTEDLRDLDQARVAIDAVRALLPLVEERDAEQARAVRDALAQLQMAYAQVARATGAPPEGGTGGAEGGPAGEPRETPPAQPQSPSQRPGRPPDSGGLWVPPGSVK